MRSPRNTRLSRWSHTGRRGAEGYLLPIIIALGLGISTLAIVAFQNLVTNSTRLNTQTYNEIAREAAQSGVAEALSCIESGAAQHTGTPSWDTVALTPSKSCEFSDVTGRAATVADTSLYSSTYSVDKPIIQGTTAKSYLITSVGKVTIKSPSNGSSSTISQTVHAFGTQTGATTRGFKPVASLSAGPSTACVVTSGGDDWVYCWGSNGNYQIGNGQSGNRQSPTAVATAAIPSVPPSGCSWLGCSNPGSPAVPANPMIGKKVTKVSVGTNNTCAIATDQDGSNPRVYCWGKNDYGQLGNSSTDASTVPVAVDASGPKAAVPGTPPSGCSWLGCSNPGTPTIPARPATGLFDISQNKPKDVIDISAGNGFSCALTSDGLVSCWGLNDNGQLGVGDRTNRTMPTTVYRKDATPAAPSRPATPATVFWTKKATKLAIVKNANTMCAIMNDGSSTCWGENYSGQTGSGTHATPSSDTDCAGGSGNVSVPGISTAADALVPATVQTTQKFDAITLTSGSNYGYATALTSDTKRLYWWGGSTSGSTTKGRVCGHGGGHGTGQGPGNNKWIWTATRNYSAQGTPTGPLYNSSTANPPTLNNGSLALVSGVSNGGLLCAQLATSELYCDSHGDTGKSNDGQLGNGYVYTCTGWCAGPTNFTTPQKVATNGTVYSVDGKSVKSDIAVQTLVTMDTGLSGYTCVVTTSGRVACWGVNGSGQLGTGDTNRRGVPTFNDINAATSGLSAPGSATKSGMLITNLIYF